MEELIPSRFVGRGWGGCGAAYGCGKSKSEILRQRKRQLRRREVKWSALPEGLVVADKPEKLDDALVGLLLFMRWPTPHGWQVGKITSKITPATPRLFKSFNYRCSWSDGWSNQMLRLDEYGGGDEAEYNSWVILEKAAPVREEAGSS